MSTNLVPSNIAEIIEQKRQAILAERQRKQEAEHHEREEAEAVGKAKYDKYIQAALLKIPEYLRQYAVAHGDEPDLYRIGKGWETPNDWLRIEVPGLAAILFAPNAKGSPWKYQTAHPYEQRYGYDGETVHVEPSLSFSDRQYDWTDDIAYALGCAQKAMLDYQNYVAEYAAKQQEIAKGKELRQADAEAKEARNLEAQTRRELEQQKEQAEEQALFEAIKEDSIAIHLLKAFVLLRDERSSFREQLESADWTMYNMEERHSRRAEELRRQADEVERRAEDERARLQSDLDETESKLKKAQRGW
jgi:hypothetical protein